MAIFYTASLYRPFKINRPLTQEERESMYCKGQPKNHRGGLVTLSFDTVIRMNSTYLEVVDTSYPTKGTISSMMMCMLLFISGLSIWFVWGMLFSDDYKGGMTGGLLFFIIPSFFGLFCIKIILGEWFGETHYPVRFNCQTQMVHVYQMNGCVLSIPWRNVYFTTSNHKLNCYIVGHVLDVDKNTILNTFGFGYSGVKETLDSYWEFIRCYMEENVIDELADIVVLCPPIENRREGYVFGLQNMMKIGSRLEWPMALIMSPLNFIESIGRYIAMQTSKIPQWPQEVLDVCQVASDDPVNVSAENNPEHLWRYVLANESREIFDERDKKLKAANARIKEKLNARYGEQ